jgi:proliferating cell nuclear antigen
VSLVNLQLSESGFQGYRCDQEMNLGVNLVELTKILKMSDTEDTVTLRAAEESNFLTILFENISNLITKKPKRVQSSSLIYCL